MSGARCHRAGALARLGAPIGRALRGRDGVALLVALFVVVIMTLTVVDFAYVTQIDANVAANNSDDLRAFYLARSAVRAGLVILGVDSLVADTGGVPTVADSRLSVWASQELIAYQQINQQLMRVADGRAILGRMDERCAPVWPAEGEDFEGPIVDEDRKVSLGNLVQGQGTQSEKVDFMTYQLARNLLDNWLVKADEEAGALPSGITGGTLASALVDWMDTDEFDASRAIPPADLQFGSSSQRLPADTTYDAFIGYPDGYEERYYLNLADFEKELPEGFPPDCAEFVRPEIPNAPITDLRELCYVAGFFDVMRVYPQFWEFVRSNFSPFQTQGLNLLTTTRPIIEAMPVVDVAQSDWFANNSLRPAGGDEGSDPNDEVIDAILEGQMEPTVAPVSQSVQQFFQGLQVLTGLDPQAFPDAVAITTYQILKTRSSVFTINGTGCMDYGLAEQTEEDEPLSFAYFKENPVKKEIRATYRRDGANYRPMAWKVL